MLDCNKIIVPVQTVEVSGYVISSFIKTAAGPGGLVVITTRQDKQLLVLKERNDVIVSEIAPPCKPATPQLTRQNKDACTYTDENSAKDVCTCTEEKNAAKDADTQTSGRKRKYRGENGGKSKKKKRCAGKRAMDENGSDDSIQRVKKTSSTTLDITTKSKNYRTKNKKVQCYSKNKDREKKRREEEEKKRDGKEEEDRPKKKRGAVFDTASGGSVHETDDANVDERRDAPSAETAQPPPSFGNEFANLRRDFHVNVDRLLHTLDGIPPLHTSTVTASTSSSVSSPSISELVTPSSSDLSSTSSETGFFTSMGVSATPQMPTAARFVTKTKVEPMRQPDHRRTQETTEQRSPFVSNVRYSSSVPDQPLQFVSELRYIPRVDKQSLTDGIFSDYRARSRSPEQQLPPVTRAPQYYARSRTPERRFPPVTGVQYHARSRTPEQRLPPFTDIQYRARSRTPQRRVPPATDIQYPARSKTPEQRLPPFTDIQYRTRSRTPQRRVPPGTDIQYLARSKTPEQRIPPVSSIRYHATSRTPERRVPSVTAGSTTRDQPSSFVSQLKYRVIAQSPFAHDSNIQFEPSNLPRVPAQPMPCATNLRYKREETEQPSPFNRGYSRIPPDTYFRTPGIPTAPYESQRRPVSAKQPMSPRDYDSRFGGMESDTRTSFHTLTAMDTSDVEISSSGLLFKAEHSHTNLTYKTSAPSVIRYHGRPKTPERRQDHLRPRTPERPLFTQEELEMIYQSLDRIPSRSTRKSEFPFKKKKIIFIPSDALPKSPIAGPEVQDRMTSPMQIPPETVQPRTEERRIQALTESFQFERDFKPVEASTPRKQISTLEVNRTADENYKPMVTYQGSDSNVKGRVRRKLFSDYQDDSRPQKTESSRSVRFVEDFSVSEKREKTPPEKNPKRTETSRTDLSAEPPRTGSQLHFDSDSGIGGAQNHDPSRRYKFKTHYVPVKMCGVSQEITVPVVTISLTPLQSHQSIVEPPTKAEIQNVLDIAGTDDGQGPEFIFRSSVPSDAGRPDIMQYTVLYRLPTRSRSKSRTRHAPNMDESRGIQTPKQMISEEAFVIQQTPSNLEPQQHVSTWERLKVRVKKCWSKEKQ